jgi:predicted nucleotidyltransferase
VTRIISCGEQVWQNTLRGNGFSQAIAAKPLWRETAEKRLDEFLARVAAVRTADFAYKVKQVILFGSYLTSQERINDIDLCVSLAPKENDRAKQAAWERRRIEEAVLHGRSFGTFLDKAGWPQDEVRHYLKARSRSLSLHGPDDGILKHCKHKVIYQDDSCPAESRPRHRALRPSNFTDQKRRTTGLNPPETRGITEWIGVFQWEEHGESLLGDRHANLQQSWAMAHFNDFLARYGELPAKVSKHSRFVTAPIGELTAWHIKQFLTEFLPRTPRADVGDEWYVPTLAKFVQWLKENRAISEEKHKELLSALTGIGTKH